MGSIKYYLGVVATVVSIQYLGFLWGPLFTIICLAVWIGAKAYYQRQVKLKMYGSHYENFYVITRHPETDEELELESMLQDLVVFAHYGKALKTVEEIKRWLDRSGNKFYQDGKLEILVIIFQDGKHVNESWEDFKFRATYEIKENRAEWHETLKSQNGTWYMTYSNKEQNVYDWKK